MFEILCVILLLIVGFLGYSCFNLIKTVFNMRERLLNLVIMVDTFGKLVEKLNKSETYYGDPTIQAFVDAANDILTALGDIVEIVNEIDDEGEDDEDKE